MISDQCENTSHTEMCAHNNDNDNLIAKTALSKCIRTDIHIPAIDPYECFGSIITRTNSQKHN